MSDTNNRNNSRQESTNTPEQDVHGVIGMEEFNDIIDKEGVSDNNATSEDEADADSEVSEDELLLADLEADDDESRLEEAESFEEEFSDEITSPTLSLAKKLKETGGNFPVTAESNYLDNLWVMTRGGNGAPNNIHFNREIEGSNELKRALIYHTIKEYSPFNHIRSYTTARVYGFNYSVMENYIFQDNHLTARPDHISLISTPLILNALARAKKSESKGHFLNLFQFIRLWINLSEHKLIPEHLRLDVRLSSIDTPENRADVFQTYFRGNVSSWVSYSEEDLEILMEYTLFWIEGVAPEMQKLADYLKDSGFAGLADRIVSRAERIPELERLMTITVNDKSVMCPPVRKHIKDSRPYFSYSWANPYGVMLDNVRNSVFILVALVTGARKSELATLKFSDLIIDANGDYWLRITRWKTARNPTKGEPDELPIPKFIGDAIRTLESLRNLESFVKDGWIFQSNQSRKVLNNATPALIEFVINQLRRQLPIERLHCHRFRKTIAEILINRDERNIDIIRALFGHRSYSMTLHYIARNPLMVRTVAIAIEKNYTREFHEIVSGIRYGGHSGEAAKRIYAQIEKRPDEFTGKQLKVSLMSYISHLLTAGEPIFIRRTAVGTYCMSAEHFTADNIPPCLKGRTVDLDNILPDPSNCQIDCKKIIILATAKQALSDNITFYSTVLENAGGKLQITAERELRRRISATQSHLNNLITTGHSENNFIEVANV